MGTLDEELEGLHRQARDALAREWSTTRWDYWCSVEWYRAVSDATANEHLERLVNDLHRTASPTIRVVAGFHADPHPHAHALVHLSRRVRMRFTTDAEFTAWLARYWYHGRVWAEAFEANSDPISGGAVTYLARNPGTVVWG